MQSSRYQNQSIYFSDVIINANSAIMNFADLCGKVFFNNDPGSNIGFYTVHCYSLMYEYSPEFFAQSLPSGSHQNSILWVAEGRAD